MIEDDWSPEQISGHLKASGLPGVSPEWIYRHIYANKSQGGTLHSHLRCQKKRRKRRGSIERRGQIIGRFLNKLGYTYKKSRWLPPSDCAPV